MWLEHDSEGKQSGVVKQILKRRPTTSFLVDYKQELLAMSRLSKVSIKNIPLIIPKADHFFQRQDLFPWMV